MECYKIKIGLNSITQGLNWYNVFQEHEMCEKGKIPIVNVNL